MGSRERQIARIERSIGRRKLLYCGTRGADAEPLLAIRQFEGVFSQIAPLGALSVPEICLEELTHERVDLDQYDIDNDQREEVRHIQECLLRAFDDPCVVVPYSSSALLASAWFPRSDRVLHLGVFYALQKAFSHKAWVESSLSRFGVKTLPWRYYSDQEIAIIRENAEVGPIVLRANRTDGGAGVCLVRDVTDLDNEWPDHGDGFLAVAPYLHPSIPINVNACVFDSGEVRSHGLSIQLIGIPEASSRYFGYCGNDYAAAKNLDSSLITRIEEMVTATGQWLAANGYCGAFGVDGLIYGGNVFLTEVNPRFQGSSVISAYLDRDLDLPDLYMDHLAACLGLDPEPTLSLLQQTVMQPALAHIVHHNIKKCATALQNRNYGELPSQCRLIPKDGIRVTPNAIDFQVVFQEDVTSDGVTLVPKYKKILESLHSTLYGCESASASNGSFIGKEAPPL